MRRASGRAAGRRLAALLLVVTALAAGGGLAARWYRTGQLLRRGEEALAAREYAQAREHLTRYLEARPGDARARLLAARAARRLRLYEEASEHLRRCRKDGGDAEAVEVEYALIEVQRGGEGPAAALRERALRDDELALVILEVLIQHDLDTYRLWEALHGLTLYLSRRPDDLQARLARGYVWERFLYFADALEDYRKAVEAHPDSPEARLRLADTLLLGGTPGEALGQYEWLAGPGRWPDRPEVRFGVARCRRRLGEVEEARRLLDALAAEFPEHGELLWERGELELDQGRPAEAEPWLRRALRSIPHDRRVSYSLSRCLRELGRREEAETFEARVQQIDADLRRLDQVCKEVMKRPDDAALRCEAGLLFLRNGERHEGVRWLQMALRLDPGCEAARAALAEADSGRP
jgi:tetratricopeptide (TPR) repeat protein